MPLTFFFVLILYLCGAIVEKKKPGIYLLTGIVTGIAGATKQTAVLGIPVILVAHLVSLWRGQGYSLRQRGLSLFSRASLKKLALFSAAAAIAFLIADPFLVMNPVKFLSRSMQTLEYVKGANQPQWTFQFTGATVGYWFTNLLYYGMGPALEILCLLGVLWALWKRKWADGLVLLFLAIYFASVGFGYMKFIRYAIPLLPFLCLLGARLAVELYGIVETRALRIIFLAGMIIVGRRRFFTPRLPQHLPPARRARPGFALDPRDHSPGGQRGLQYFLRHALFGDMFFHPRFFDSYTVGFGHDDLYKKGILYPQGVEFFHLRLGIPQPARQIQEIYPRAPRRRRLHRHERRAFRAVRLPAPGISRGSAIPPSPLRRKNGIPAGQIVAVQPAFLGLAFNDERSELSFRLSTTPRSGSSVGSLGRGGSSCDR